MIDEDKLAKAAARATRASSLLENELYIESYQALEDQLIAAWIASDPRDTEGRERCFAQVHANRKHRDYFVSVLGNGKMAAAELKELVKAAERQKLFGII